MSRRWRRMCSALVAVQLGEEFDEVGVQRDVTVVAELADRDAEPVASPICDGIGGEFAQLTGA